jgi:hypothetical protein
MEEYFGVAEAEGLSRDEIGAVQSIVMAVSAGRVGAQFRSARIRARDRRREDGRAEHEQEE